MILLGDCLIQMKTLEANSVDAVVTDPPYGLSFMGKKWDYDVPSVDIWREVFRVLKPGGHVLSFGGTRTYHRMVVNIEDAGFEIRDQVQWIYGSGFPKSCNVSKQLDKQERNKWEKISNAFDNLTADVILNEWQDFLKIADCADEKSEKSQTETGMNTPKSGSVLVSVLPKINLEKSKLNAIIAELNLSAHPLTSEKQSTVLGSVEQTEIALKKNAKSVQSESADQNHGQYIDTLIAQFDARGSQNENMELITKVAEVLMTSLGKRVCLKTEITSALCAALAGVLRHTILSRSKSFQNLDTKSQTDFASAITVTTTKSMAENLISFTVGILKSKAIDKMAGAEREVVGINPSSRPNSKMKGSRGFDGGLESDINAGEQTITAPATPEAKAWDGWGSALKPANEPICLARKPLEKGLTLAENVLKWGTGAINVDGTRIEGAFKSGWAKSGSKESENTAMSGKNYERKPKPDNPQGRWPANVLFGCACEPSPHVYPDGSTEFQHDDDCAVKMLDAQSGISKSTGGGFKASWKDGFDNKSGNTKKGNPGLGDVGGASRFFYCAKSSKRERGEGNVHPTVKPIRLMEYLITLITPPNGTVLDPFMGSGSTGVAAKSLGREFIGIEMSEEYRAIAQKRIEAAL